MHDGTDTYSLAVEAPSEQIVDLFGLRALLEGGQYPSAILVRLKLAPLSPRISRSVSDVLAIRTFLCEVEKALDSVETLAQGREWPKIAGVILEHGSSAVAPEVLEKMTAVVSSYFGQDPELAEIVDAISLTDWNSEALQSGVDVGSSSLVLLGEVGSELPVAVYQGNFQRVISVTDSPLIDVRAALGSSDPGHVRRESIEGARVLASLVRNQPEFAEQRESAFVNSLLLSKLAQIARNVIHLNVSRLGAIETRRRLREHLSSGTPNLVLAADQGISVSTALARVDHVFSVVPHGTPIDAYIEGPSLELSSVKRRVSAQVQLYLDALLATEAVANG